MSVHIDCDTCVARRTEACSDCLVSFLFSEDGGRHEGAVVLDLAEWRALRSLQEAGLAPELRHQEASGAG